jgi:ribosomal protein S18 acetylase RimI-like enzyme
VWTPPGAGAFELGLWKQIAIAPLLFEIAGYEGLRRALSLGPMLAEQHPHMAHAHLVFLGVHPSCQGQGFGSAMLKHTLAPVDAAGIAAYLETGQPENVRLYLRHGFEVTAELQAAWRPALLVDAAASAGRVRHSSAWRVHPNTDDLLTPRPRTASSIACARHWA